MQPNHEGVMYERAVALAQSSMAGIGPVIGPGPFIGYPPGSQPARQHLPPMMRIGEEAYYAGFPLPPRLMAADHPSTLLSAASADQMRGAFYGGGFVGGPTPVMPGGIGPEEDVFVASGGIDWEEDGSLAAARPLGHSWPSNLAAAGGGLVDSGSAADLLAMAQFQAQRQQQALLGAHGALPMPRGPGLPGIQQRISSWEDLAAAAAAGPGGSPQLLASPPGAFMMAPQQGPPPLLGMNRVASTSSVSSLGTSPAAGANGLFGEHPLGEHPSRTLFVRNISSQVEEAELRALFGQFGEIRSVYMACKNRGFVMVSYYDIRAARAAMKALQGYMLRKRRFDIHYSIPKDNPSERDMNQGTLVVFNLPPEVTNEELLALFSEYGEVKEVRETPNKRHHKFVEYYDLRAATAALKGLNRTELRGKTIKLEPSRPGGLRRAIMGQLAASVVAGAPDQGSSQRSRSFNDLVLMQQQQQGMPPPTGSLGSGPTNSGFGDAMPRTYDSAPNLAELLGQVPGAALNPSLAAIRQSSSGQSLTDLLGAHTSLMDVEEGDEAGFFAHELLLGAGAMGRGRPYPSDRDPDDDLSDAGTHLPIDLDLLLKSATPAPEPNGGSGANSARKIGA